MQTQSGTGIIVKTFFPRKQKVIVFDRKLGKLECVPHRPDIRAGSLITYTYNSGQSVPFLKNMNIIDVPLDLVREDILFVHHILEVCFYFLSAHQPAPEIFDLLLKLYHSEKVLQTHQSKKLFLFLLFWKLGIAPEHKQFDQVYFRNLAIKAVDTMSSEQIQVYDEKAMDAWLYHCLLLHPCFDYFKTIHFLV